MTTVVLIPIRSFDDAKSRLAPALDRDQRRHLAMEMASTVIGAAHDLPVRIVTGDPAVEEWAVERETPVLYLELNGLNVSVTGAVIDAAADGFTRAIVAHADLPRAVDLRVADVDGVAVVPDRHRDGSNVLTVPTGVGFEFAYGPGSFARHRAEAARLALPFTEIDDDSLAWDVDTLEDLPG